GPRRRPTGPLQGARGADRRRRATPDADRQDPEVRPAPAAALTARLLRFRVGLATETVAEPTRFRQDAGASWATATAANRSLPASRSSTRTASGLIWWAEVRPGPMRTVDRYRICNPTTARCASVSAASSASSA